jgi:hypothetical protein
VVGHVELLEDDGDFPRVGALSVNVESAFPISFVFRASGSLGTSDDWM